MGDKSNAEEISLASLDVISDITLVEDILQLKRKKNAVVLAHNYQSPEIQFVADFVGDTLSLAMLAKDIDQDTIVFCGPDFMVETAAILSHNKILVYANEKAKCPMAAMVTPEELRLEKEDVDNPDVGRDYGFSFIRACSRLHQWRRRQFTQYD